MRCLKPKSIVNPQKGVQMPVRCGKCLPCRSYKAGQWTIRLKEHEKYSKNNYFITLTLSDDNLSWGSSSPSLNKRDIQLFFKRYRKQFPSKISYYAVGEYGKTTKRPHYHIILFNTNAETIEEINFNLLSVWQLGMIHVGTVTPESIRYVAGYLEKDILGYDVTEEIQREFSLMSKGIGNEYINQNRTYHSETNKFEYHTGKGQFVPLPRYYREKIFTKEKIEEYAEATRVRMVAQSPKGIKAEADDLNARISRLKAKLNLNKKRK